jgi:hypothetical protein
MWDSPGLLINSEFSDEHVKIKIMKKNRKNTNQLQKKKRDERNDSIVFLVSCGFASSEVGLMYNLSHESVRLICKGSGISTSSDKWKLNNLKLRFGEAAINNEIKRFYGKQTAENKRLLYREFKSELNAVRILKYPFKRGKFPSTPIDVIEIDETYLPKKRRS